MGFPSEDGGKAVLYDRMSVGVTESCRNKEAAWRFVSSLLGGEPLSPATKEQIDVLFEGICNAQSNRIFDSNIWNIIAEDVNAYFEGSKTIDEVMELIQGRVSIYVSENY